MEGLSNQHTISDLDTSDTLTLNSGMSPLHLFMFLLLAVWGFLYVNGRQTEQATKAMGGGPPTALEAPPAPAPPAPGRRAPDLPPALAGREPATATPSCSELEATTMLVDQGGPTA
eukprot:CAMPEP_0181451842 /NCGR_PEP_ID=MMETSP1110-20121109/28899_1 /TAXON_ID=174948 /ORGANISM="Symbiodinium sp., Strain CCMP421" /LENGTH=115 /DNA_ID=CAMNT_0023576105 /DNA_START=128 /DNA_END=476 /DNA_ORIENTATION=-